MNEAKLCPIRPSVLLVFWNSQCRASFRPLPLQHAMPFWCQQNESTHHFMKSLTFRRPTLLSRNFDSVTAFQLCEPLPNVIVGGAISDILPRGTLPLGPLGSLGLVPLPVLGLPWSRGPSGPQGWANPPICTYPQILRVGVGGWWGCGARHRSGSARVERKGPAGNLNPNG